MPGRKISFTPPKRLKPKLTKDKLTKVKPIRVKTQATNRLLCKELRLNCAGKIGSGWEILPQALKGF
jgi:hypothetical protein